MQLLTWDSDFFGFKIGSVSTNNLSEEQLTEILNSARNQDFKLIYFFASPQDENSNKTLADRGAVLVDQKIIYEMDITNFSGQSDAREIESVTMVDDMDSLMSLGLQSGEYSRFKTDPNFTDEQFKRFYSTWLTKSLHREIANEFLVHLDGSNINGFITGVVKGTIGVIGLIAVDEQSRGKSIGKKLIHHMCSFFRKNNISMVDVATQLQNVNACKFYTKIGFKEKSITNIYHYWQS